MTPDNDPLLRYIRRPSRRRLERVVRVYHEHVWRVAHRVTGHAEDAQDICQDVFLRLLLEPPSVGEVRSPGGYLAWCVVGRASKLRRAAERRLGREREAAARLVGRDVSAEDAEAVRTELEKLPDDLRLPFELHYIAGIANAEVASMLGLPLRTLEQRLHDGRERLKRRLAPLLLGVPVAVGTCCESVPAAPPGLLSQLLRVAREGTVLSAAPLAGLAVVVGGVAMTKKTIAVAGALALLVASLAGSWAVLRTKSAAPQLEPVAAVPVVSAPGAAVAGPVATAAAAELELPPEPPRAAVRGVVKDEEGAVVPGAAVGFRDHVPPEHAERLRALGYRNVPEGSLRLDTIADAGGEFSFNELLPGEATVIAGAPGMQRSGPEFELEAGKTSWQTVELLYLRRLHGSVLDPHGAPVAHATVLLPSWNVAESSALRLVGDANRGYVMFPADAQGRFDTGACLFPQAGLSLLAWGEGHGMGFQRNPVVAESRYVGSVELMLEAEMPVRIAVRDPQGRALEGVEVGVGVGEGHHRGLTGSIPYPFCVTDSQGFAQVRHLPRKKQPLLLALKGFRTVWLDLQPDGPELHTLIMQPEAAGAELTVRLTYEEPFPEVFQSWGVLTLERAGEGGSFRPVDGNPAELHHRQPAVTFRPPESGRFRCRLGYRQGGELIGEPFDHLASQQQTVEFAVTLPGPYVVGVLVDAATGSPVSGRRVVAHCRPRGKSPRTWTDAVTYGGVPFPHVAGWSRAGETDASGRFIILLPRDECPLEVSVRHDGVRSGWAGPEELELGADDKVTDLRLELRPGGGIEGQVLDESGAPVPGETVVAYDGGANLDRRTSDAEGRFRFDGLRPGAYALETIGVLTHSGVGISSGGEGFEAGLLDPADVFDRRVTVRQGETTSAAIVLERDRRGAIEGVLGEGLPRTGRIDYCVLIADQPRRVLGWHGDTEARDGAFRFCNLHAGRYRVTFRAPSGSAGAVAEVRRGHVERIVLRPSSGVLSIPLPALEPDAGSELKVAVLERRGSAWSDTVACEPWSWEQWTEHRVERRDGAIVISGLPTGIWRAKVESPHLPDAWTESASVQDGCLTETSVLVVSKPCSASVRLELEDGSPVPADARVIVFDACGSVSCRIETDSDDPALRRLTKLPAGTFKLRVEWPGRLAEAQLTVREGEVAEVRLLLPPE